MTDDSIQDAETLYNNGHHTIGVMSSNEWRPHMNKSILNLSPHGSHWVSIKKINNNHFIYDDPFGVVPPTLKTKNSIIEYDPYQEQKIEQVNCGKRAFNSLV